MLIERYGDNAPVTAACGCHWTILVLLWQHQHNCTMDQRILKCCVAIDDHEPRVQSHCCVLFAAAHTPMSCPTVLLIWDRVRVKHL